MRVVLLVILFLSSAAFRSKETVSESVDLIELNHFYDKMGQIIYDQVIFYEKAPENGRFRVRAWCLADDREHPNRRPVKSETTGFYHVDWRDTDAKLLRHIKSRLLRETWTQADPEREDKKQLHESLRRSLIKKVGELNDFQPN
jgi:hypothetical protein